MSNDDLDIETDVKIPIPLDVIDTTSKNLKETFFDLATKSPLHPDKSLHLTLDEASLFFHLHPYHDKETLDKCNVSLGNVLGISFQTLWDIKNREPKSDKLFLSSFLFSEKEKLNFSYQAIEVYLQDYPFNKEILYWILDNNIGFDLIDNNNNTVEIACFNEFTSIFSSLKNIPPKFQRIINPTQVTDPLRINKKLQNYLFFLINHQHHDLLIVFWEHLEKNEFPFADSKYYIPLQCLMIDLLLTCNYFPKKNDLIYKIINQLELHKDRIDTFTIKSIKTGNILQIALSKNYDTLALDLIDRFGAKLFMEFINTHNGETPLLTACIHNKWKAVKKILKYPCKFMHYNDDNKSAYYYIMENGPDDLKQKIKEKMEGINLDIF